MWTTMPWCEGETEGRRLTVKSRPAAFHHKNRDIIRGIIKDNPNYACLSNLQENAMIYFCYSWCKNGKMSEITCTNNTTRQGWWTKWWGNGWWCYSCHSQDRDDSRPDKTEGEATTEFDSIRWLIQNLPDSKSLHHSFNHSSWQGYQANKTQELVVKSIMRHVKSLGHLTEGNWIIDTVLARLLSVQ